MSTTFDPLHHPAHRVQPTTIKSSPIQSVVVGASPPSTASSTAPTTALTTAPTTAAASGTPAAVAVAPAVESGESAAATPGSTTTPGAAATAGSAVAPVVPPPPVASPGPTVRAWTVQQLSTPIAQVAGQAVTRPDGTQVMVIRISPESLGPVTLEATHRDGVVRLEIAAGTDAGRENLRLVLGELRRELASAHTGATLDLSTGSRDAGGRDANASNQGAGHHGAGASLNDRTGQGHEPEKDDVGTASTATTADGAMASPGEPGGSAEHGTDRDHDPGGLDVYA
ncbi:flagellar hook-length control protein FliK [Citricoccus sp. GCM10030269]|uniref:flagellar hook-length control protein FliK n=1 Tax=Citricoccus sp. GCM10030269 TaxID=3273388 RepID=UPI003617A88A